MSGLYLTILALVLAAGLVVKFLNCRTRKAHARFQRQDVLDAISEMVSKDSRSHDAWDLFLGWPIDDPDLESVRQRCLAIVKQCPRQRPTEDISPEGLARLQSILNELL